MGPTILSAAGLTAAYQMDGVDLLPLLSSAETVALSDIAKRRCIVMEIDQDRAVTCFPDSVLGTGTRKYLSVVGGEASTTYPAAAEPQQIYLLESDPAEQSNAFSATAPGIIDEFERLMLCHDQDTDSDAGSVCQKQAVDFALW